MGAQKRRQGIGEMSWMLTEASGNKLYETMARSFEGPD